MTPLSLLSLVTAAVGTATATAISQRDVTVNRGFVSIPIEYRRSIVPVIKRADTDVPLFNISAISYLVALSVGTPGQAVKVAIDTGSDELWVNPQCSNVDDAQQKQECIDDGQYDPGTSSTSQMSQSTSRIPYGKGEVTIQYYRDSISLPDSTISLTQVVFGVATKSTDLNEGIMGLGYGNGVNLRYNNFIDTLAVQNVTQSRAFTVALGSVDANNGGIIIFGGVDTKKFSGRLTQLTILGPQGRETVRRYWVTMESVGSSVSGQQSQTYPNSGMAIVLDSGSSLSYLPQAIVTRMANDTGARFSQSAQAYLVSCSQINSASTFDFTFGSGSNTVRIQVPWREFIWQASPSDCVLGALPVQSGSGVTALLGDTFMRSAYTVFDQTSNAIFMGQYVNCGQNEQVISGSSGAVANFNGECAAPNVMGTKPNSGPRTFGEPGTTLALWLGTVATLAMGFLV